MSKKNTSARTREAAAPVVEAPLPPLPPLPPVRCVCGGAPLCRLLHGGNLVAYLCEGCTARWTQLGRMAARRPWERAQERSDAKGQEAARERLEASQS